MSSIKYKESPAETWKVIRPPSSKDASLFICIFLNKIKKNMKHKQKLQQLYIYNSKFLYIICICIVYICTSMV